ISNATDIKSLTICCKQFISSRIEEVNKIHGLKKTCSSISPYFNTYDPLMENIDKYYYKNFETNINHPDFYTLDKESMYTVSGFRIQTFQRAALKWLEYEQNCQHADYIMQMILETQKFSSYDPKTLFIIGDMCKDTEVIHSLMKRYLTDALGHKDKKQKI